MNSFKWVWQYLRQFKFLMLLGFCLVIGSSFLNMVIPYASGVIVDEVIIGKNTGILIVILGIMAGAVLIRNIIAYSFQIIFEYVSQKVIVNIRESIYAKLQELDFNFFDRTRTGDIMSRMTGDLDAVRHFIAWVLYMIFQYVTIFIFVIITLCSVDFTLTMTLLAAAPIIAVLAYKMSFRVKPAFTAIRDQFSRLNSMVQENISGNRVVKAFAREGYEIEKFSKENDNFKLRNMEASAVWEKFLPVLDVLAGSLSVTILLAGGFMVMRGTLTIGELVTFNSLAWALNNPMKAVGWLINDTQRFSASGDKIIALMGTEPKIKNPKNHIKTGSIKGMVEFRDVSFSYGDEEVLKDICFRAKPGQTVAIIGPTGSGKSTLLNLICRFYDCTEGELLIDGIDIRKMDIRKLRANIAVAMQDIFLFSDTIEGNIAYGVPDASMQQIQKAANVAGAHDFIVNFPEGYDTIVGERGVGLSGGQKQRIALARALLKSPSILILDDTTSSVDIETEHEIHKTLNSYYTDKTTFIIAHRISSVKNADMILVLDNGRIVEQGTHEELLTKRSYYYNVFVNQFGDFDQIAREVG